MKKRFLLMFLLMSILGVYWIGHPKKFYSSDAWQVASWEDTWQKLQRLEQFFNYRGLIFKKISAEKVGFSSKAFRQIYQGKWSLFFKQYDKDLRGKIIEYLRMATEFIRPPLGAIDPLYQEEIIKVRKKKEALENIFNFLQDFKNQPMMALNELRESLMASGIELTIWKMMPSLNLEDNQCDEYWNRWGEADVALVRPQVDVLWEQFKNYQEAMEKVNTFPWSALSMLVLCYEERFFNQLALP